jgi:hypothetical protein
VRRNLTVNLVCGSHKATGRRSGIKERRGAENNASQSRNGQAP